MGDHEYTHCNIGEMFCKAFLMRSISEKDFKYRVDTGCGSLYKNKFSSLVGTLFQCDQNVVTGGQYYHLLYYWQVLS